MPIIDPTFLILAAAPTTFPWGVWLPYLTGAVILVIGLSTLKKQIAEKQALDKIIALGPMFIAVPIAIFGTEHFTTTRIIAGMVPGWIPWHMFWALFVGTCLIAAALSIAAGKYARIASPLLGLMILLFVCLIHIPNIVRAPHERILWVVAVRDFAFAGGAFSLSPIRGGWKPMTRHGLVTLARLSLAVAILVFGVQQFLHPELAPGVPLEKATPLWIPGRLLWSYLTGVIFVVSGIGMLLNQKVRLAATLAALMTLLLVAIVYVPILLSKPWDIGESLNYFADTLLVCGSLFALAGSQDEPLPLEHVISEPEQPSIEARVG